MSTLHKELLASLFQLKTGPQPSCKSIRLVARIRDAQMLGGVRADRIIVFFPDFHLTSAERENEYEYGFNKRSPGIAVRRRDLMDSLLKKLVQFNKAHAARVARTYQLGDLIDLWREGRFKLHLAVNDLAIKILENYPTLGDLLLSPDGADSLKASFVYGNHDDGITKARDLERAKRAIVPKLGVAGTADENEPVLITHGDAFDTLEALPDDRQIKALQSRLGLGATGCIYELDGAHIKKAGASVVPGFIDADFTWDEVRANANVPDYVNVRTAPLDAKVSELNSIHEQLSGDPIPSLVNTVLTFLAEIGGERRPGLVEAMPQIRTGAGAIYKELNKQGSLPPKLPKVKMVVVGHSHWPRIVRVGEPADPNSFILFDCGAWLEQSKWRDGTHIDNCQIGVLCGDDARIYQLDPLD